MTATIPLYPHRVSQQLRLRLSSFDDLLSDEPVQVSGPSTRSKDQDGDEAVGLPSYSIISGAAEWRRLGFRIEVQLSPEQIQWVLPPGVSPSGATRMVALITCQPTKLRRAVHLIESTSGIWTGEAALLKEDVSQRVTFLPQLLLTRDLDVPANSTYAFQRASLIGIGEQVRLELATVPRSATSAVEVFWEDFESSSNVWRRANAEDVFNLSIEDRPVVYLNSRYHELRDILESTSKRGSQAAQRELAAALIAHPVLVQLSSIALSAVRFDDSTQTSYKPGGWQGDMLDTLLPSLYPGLPSMDAALRRVGEDAHDPFTAADLLARVGTCVQRMISTHETIETAIRAFEGAREDREADAD
jgi:hypothetical protein